MKKITTVQNTVGWIGSVSLVLAYTLLTFDVVAKDSLAFNAMQLVGGLALGYRVWLDRNWSNLALEVFFVSVALYALYTIII